MQINSFKSTTPNPNFGIAYKELSRVGFKPLAKELEGRVGIHCIKTGDNVHVVFATVPHSIEENDCLAKYGAKHITPIEAKKILGRAVEIVQKNFGKLLKEVEIPFVDTAQGVNANTRRTRLSKGRIEGFLTPAEKVEK